MTAGRYRVYAWAEEGVRHRRPHCLAVSRIEQGRHAVPFATVEKLLAAMGYTLGDLHQEEGMR